MTIKPQTMRAAVFHTFGGPDVIRIEDLPIPQPRDHEVMVRVHTATVTSADSRIRRQWMPLGFNFMGRLIFGFKKPRNPILGTDFAGEVEAVGAKVTKFSVGDRVCGLSGMGFATHAEYKCISEKGAITHIPHNIDDATAVSAMFGGSAALYYLQNLANALPGEKMLVVGASGAVGNAAVQLGKYLGLKITAVCSGRHIEMVKASGADDVIDYQKEDLTKRNKTFDIIFDAIGNITYKQHHSLLTPKGRLLLCVASLPEILQAPFHNLTHSQKIISGTAPEKSEQLQFLLSLVKKGIFRPHISKRFSLENIVEAYTLVDSGHKTGNIVLTIK